MKTAMTELIEAINLITKTYKRGLSTEEILDMCNNQLDKEKEQIQKAFSDGQETPINHPTLPHYSNEEYFNDNYNQNK